MVGEPLICVVHVYKLDYATMLYGESQASYFLPRWQL